jgi:hypothetical protein
MDEIYSKAVQVSVHLGPGDEKSDVACKAVKRLAYAYLPAKLAQKSGIGVEMTREKYEAVADEVLGKLFVRLRCFCTGTLYKNTASIWQDMRLCVPH